MNEHIETETYYPHFTFDIPPNFHELPLTADPSDWCEQLRGLVTEMHGAVSSEHLGALTDLLAGLTEQLREQDVVHASLAAPTISGHPSAASLTVASYPLNYRDPQIAVEGIAALQAARKPDGCEAHTVQLPAGPAASVITESHLRVPSNKIPTDENMAIELGQFQTYVPVPGQRRMLVFTLEISSLPDWEVYAHVMGEIVHSLSFTEPDRVPAEESQT